MKQEENYSILCPKELKCRYRGAQMRNFLGFLVYRWNGYSEYRKENEGWFFVTNSDILNAIGGSKTTVRKYQAKFSLDGVIDFRSGNFSGRKANEYRLPFLEGKCTEKCTEDNSVNQTVTEKSVPMIEIVVETTQKCTEKCTEKHSQMHDPKMNKKCTEDLLDFQSVEIKKCTEENPIKTSEKCTTDTESDNIKSVYNESTSTSACENGFAHNFRNTIEICLERKEQVPSLIRKDARKWVWKKWNSFQYNSRMSVAERLKWFKTFKEWFIVVCDTKEKYTDVLRTISGQFAVTTADRIFNDFQSLTDGITADKYLKDPAKYSGAKTEAENALKELYRVTSTPLTAKEKALAKLECIYTSRTQPILEIASLDIKDPDVEFRCSEEDAAETPANVQQEGHKGKVGGCYGDLPY